MKIKFRAWDIENEYMITSKQGVFTALRNIMDITRQNDGYYNNGELLKPNKNKYELMQFTGLHDKNGKEIYESDVVEVTREGILERGVVIFGSGCYFIKVKEHFLNSVTLLPLHECSRNDYKLKVIGNIYENSDLLGE